MPRTRRTPASDTPAEDAAQVETPPVNSDTPVTAEPSSLSAAATEPSKTPRRRAPRVPKVDTAVVDSTPPADAPKPPARRRGSRTGSTEAAPAGESPSAEPAPTPAPRRRGRRTAAPEAAAASAPAAPETPAEAAAEIPDLEAPVVTPAAPARRRGRSRQSAAVETPEPPAETQNTEAQNTETQSAESAEEPTTRRRRGRRRSTGAAEVASSPVPDLEAPVDEDAAEPGAEEPGEGVGEDGAKPGRRSRRGRRRRGGLEEVTTEMLEAAGSPLLLQEEVEEIEAPEDDDDALLVYPPPAPPTYAAPPLVARALPPADDQSVPRVSAHLTPQGQGLSQLRINRIDHAPYFFFVNTETALDGETVDAQIREAAASGIHLFSGVMYLPLRNAYGERSFGAIDALVQQVLAADPNGFVLPRLQCVPTNFWVRTHPEELAAYSNGEEGDVSLASTEFWADCVDALEALIAHFNDPETPGGDRVIGFHLDRGEWFYDAQAGYDLSPPNQVAFQNWLHAKYQNLYALRAAWHDAEVTFDDAAIPAWPGVAAVLKKTDTPLYSMRREGRWPDYAQFSSEIVAEIISGLAEAIKTFSQGSLLVAASYGYTLEFAGRGDSGHLALGKLLQSPYIDIVAGPNSYAGRGVGSPAAFGAPLDSVALHGKLWLVEDDTKTFLAETETDDSYNPKISSGADTQAIHQRHFGAALAHRAGVTWMDLWGQGWLNSPNIWHELGSLAQEAARWGQIAPSTPAAPDVAVFVDEASIAYLKTDPGGLGTDLVGRTRDLLLRSGGSVGFYLQSDVLLPNFPDAKLYLFLNALRLTTEERAAIREKLQKPGKTLAWLYAAGIFDENGPSLEEAGEVVGMALRPQPWNSRSGSQLTEIKHPLTERLRGVKRLGTEEIMNPLYAVTDPQATVLAEYAATGAASLAVREHKGGWKSVFFGDPQLTTELLRGLYAYANIPVYDTQDDAVFAGGDGSLTIHGSFTGQRTLSLPRKASVYDVFEQKIIATNVRSFRAFVRARTTRLYLWGDGAALARATGLDLPEQSGEADPPPPPPPSVSTPPPLTAREPRPAPVSAIPGLDSAPTSAPNLTEEESGTFTEIGLAEIDLEPGTSPFIDEPDAGDLADGVGGEETDGTETPSRRSRWQRRRAATRARREAERAAKLAEGVDGGPGVPTAPLDFAALMPGLPPRRTPPPASARVADIVAADIADGEAFGLSGGEEADIRLPEIGLTDAAALGLSDTALIDMADDLRAAQDDLEGGD